MVLPVWAPCNILKRLEHAIMAQTVLTLQKEKKTTQESLSDFIVLHRTVFLSVLAVFVVGLVALCVALGLSDRATSRGIAAVDSIEYALVRESSGLSDDELSTRRETALESLAPYAAKNGIVGVRAAMLSADVHFQKQDFAAARESYLAAAQKGKKTYTEPLNYFNAAVCSEQLSDTASAATYYGQAAESADFLLRSRALFALGRTKEALSDLQGAINAYRQLVDLNITDSWTNLAHSRLIVLETE